MKRKRIVPILCFLLFFCLLVSCTRESTALPVMSGLPSNVPITVTTVLPTIVPTNAKTPKPTRVPLTEEQKGIPQADAEILLSDLVSDGVQEGELALEGAYYLDEDTVFLSQSAENIWQDVLTSMSLVYPYTPGDEYSQYEFSFDIRVNDPEGKGAAWMACFIGIRVEEVKLDVRDGGLWIAFNGTDSARIYSDGSQFPTGGKSYKLPESIGGESYHTMTVVDTGDKINWYITGSDGERSLWLSAVTEDGGYTAYDSSGKKLVTSSCKLPETGYVKYWNHMGVTAVKNITVKGA